MLGKQNLILNLIAREDSLTTSTNRRTCNREMGGGGNFPGKRRHPDHINHLEVTTRLKKHCPIRARKETG